MEIYSKFFDEIESLFVEGDGRYCLEVAGEPHYQNYLKSLYRSYLKEGGKQELIAKLHYENNNPNDKNAIRVVVNGGTVGYLSREDAKLYRKRLGKAGKEGRIISCNAKIFDGKRVWLIKKTNFAVRLDLPIEVL